MSILFYLHVIFNIASIKRISKCWHFFMGFESNCIISFNYKCFYRIFRYCCLRKFALKTAKLGIVQSSEKLSDSFTLSNLQEEPKQAIAFSLWSIFTEKYTEKIYWRKFNVILTVSLILIKICILNIQQLMKF